MFIQDVADDWKEGWVKSMKKREGPKTLEEIHKDAANEESKSKVEKLIHRTVSLPSASSSSSSQLTQSSNIMDDDDHLQLGGKRGPRQQPRQMGNKDMNSGMMNRSSCPMGPPAFQLQNRNISRNYDDKNEQFGKTSTGTSQQLKSSSGGSSSSFLIH